MIILQVTQKNYVFKYKTPTLQIALLGFNYLYKSFKTSAPPAKHISIMIITLNVQGNKYHNNMLRSISAAIISRVFINNLFFHHLIMF